MAIWHHLISQHNPTRKKAIWKHIELIDSIQRKHPGIDEFLEAAEELHTMSKTGILTRAITNDYLHREKTHYHIPVLGGLADHEREQHLGQRALKNQYHARPRYQQQAELEVGTRTADPHAYERTSPQGTYFSQSARN